MSKAKSGSEKNDNSSKRWASTVSISDNVARQGVELHFDREPHPELQSKMRVIGFMPSKSTAMWYAKDTSDTREFADNVKTVLPMLATGPDLLIQPSYEPGKANIENKRFSFVHISLKDGQEKSFIVFEPSKPRAEVLAANFAYKHYGSNYFALAVNPKSNMREARMLFAEGKIIGETESEEASYETNETVAGKQKEESSPANETMQVTFGGEKADLSRIIHEFHKWLKDHPEHKGSTKVKRPVFDEWLKQQHPEVNARETETLWDRHQRLVKIMHRIGNLDTKQIVVEPYSSIYKKLLTIIPGLMEQLESGESFSGKSEVEGYQDLHFDYLRKDEQGYVIALAHYYELNGDLVSDPDMEIRIIPEMKMAEAMTFQNIYTYDQVYIREESGKELVDTKMKSKLNSYLKEWLSTLISYGHKVKLVTEEERHSEHEEEAIPEKEPEPAEPQVFKVNLENVQPVVGVEEHESEYGESRKIPESTYRAIEGILKHCAAGAFTYDGKVWILDKDGQWNTIIQQLTGKGAINPIPKFPTHLVLNPPAKDPLATELGFYTPQSAKARFEVIVVPTPPETYKIELHIVLTTYDDYRTGFILKKEFGQPSSRHYQPSQKDAAFYNRWEAMGEVLAEIIGECNDDAEADNYFDKKPELRSKFSDTLEAIYKFAEDRGYTRAELQDKSKAAIFNLQLSLTIPVPDLKGDGSKTGMSLRLTRTAHDRVERSLSKLRCEVFYYERKAWRLNNGNMQHLPDLDAKGEKYYKTVYQQTADYRAKAEEKNKESISLHKEENEDPELGKKAYEGLTKIIPELEKFTKGEKTQGTLKYQLWSENKELTCFLNPEYQTLFLIEEVNGEKHLESDIRIDVEAKEAYVTSEWLSDYYSEGLGRTEGNMEYEGDDMALGRDMTRGLIQWMGDLTDEGLTVKLSPQDAEDENPLEFLGEPEIDEGETGKIAFNPTVMAKQIIEDQDNSDKWRSSYSEEPMPSRNRFSKEETRKLKDFYNTYILGDETKEEKYREVLKTIKDASFIISEQVAIEKPASELKRFFSPEEEKEILKTFSDFGYTSPFTVKEAFDRKLPVLDVCQRSQSVEVYFHDHYGEPLKVQIRKLEVKAKKGKYKPRSKEDTAIKGQLFELGLKLSRAEKAYQDEFLLFQDDFVAYVLEKAKASGYQPENEQELIDFQVFVVESVFDGRTVEYYPREPIGKLVAELISDFFDADKKAAAAEAQKNAGVRVVDIIRYGALVPNVMIPAQTKEPFISAYFTDYDLKEVIKKSFPYLRKLTNKTLLKASPLEMFELVQMSHPTDYGIKVDRSDMLREWERRGKKLFIGLGFPIDPEYPYVNVNTGYDSVEPLNQLLFDHNKEGNQWWAVADNWRPVADLQKALVFIDSQIETVKDRMKETINPKTKKPQGSFKDEHRQLQFNLRDFEESRQFIADYLAKHKAQHPLLQEPEKNDEDAGQVMPVYINEAIAVPDIRIKDPADQSSRKRTISKKAYDILSAKLTKANSDVLFYQGGAFTLLKSGEELLLIEQPELEATATNYFDNIFRKSKECKDREKERKKDFVKELKEAEWQETHGRDPIDKITMNGVVYHRVRLLERVLEEFKYLYVSDQIDLVNQLHEVFNQRPKLEYQDAFGKADPGIRPVAASYVKNTILDNDFITSDKNYPALKYVLAALQAVPVTNKTSELKAKPATKAVVEQHKEQAEQGMAKNGLLELKAAFWGAEDGKYPADKILINGQAFSQVRLRHEFERLLGNLPLPEQHTIIDTLGKKYPLAYDVDDYAKGLVTIGKTGAKREKVVLAGYMDNIIRQHDFPIKGKRDYSVCRLLIELLLNPKNETGKDISENPAVTVEAKRVVIIPFPKSSQFEGEVKVLDDNGVFIVGAQYNKRFGSQSFEKTNPGDNGKKYSNLNAAITDGIAWIKDRLLFEMQHKDGVYNSEAKKNVKVKAALEALEIFAKEYEPGKENLVDVPMKEKPALRKINKTDQHQLNKQIEALIDEKDSKGASFSDEEKNLIRQYTGSGGLLKQGATGRGVLYEYYTPDWLVEQMWQLARMYGYNGGSVLEPSVGTGNFLKHAPETAIVFGFETNHYSARISQVLYPHAHIHEKAFESLFFAGNIHLKDKIDHPLFSLVIGNPPYGEFTGKYAGMGEKKWTGALEYDQYFMLRGLDLLEPGGLMVFVVPSLFIQSEHKYNKTKEKIFQKAEVLKCFRLPQGVFKTTDIGTDIIVLKKRSATEATRIQVGGIDVESLPFGEAMKPMKCSITGLAIKKGDKIFYDLDKKVFIKALKIKGGDNPREIVLNNLWLPDTIKELFEKYMAQNGDRNELNEKYYSEDAIYDPALVIEAGVEYIHEAMFDEKVSSCWLHKIDITEAFGD